jgi:hypothetical protein
MHGSQRVYKISIQAVPEPRTANQPFAKIGNTELTIRNTDTPGTINSGTFLTDVCCVMSVNYFVEGRSEHEPTHAAAPELRQLVEGHRDR